MNMFYFYLILLLLILVLLYMSISLSINFAPEKIKLLSIFALSLLALRYIAVFILLIYSSIKYLYLLKPMIFLNSLSVPVLGMLSIYILARKDKLKLNYIIIMSLLILLFYVFAISKFQINIELYKNLGYRIYFLSNNLLENILLIINTIFFFSTIILLSDSISNKFGMGLALVSSFVVMVEAILKALGISIFPVSIFGDLFWIITSVYSLNKLKRS